MLLFIFKPTLSMSTLYLRLQGTRNTINSMAQRKYDKKLSISFRSFQTYIQIYLRGIEMNIFDNKKRTFCCVYPYKCVSV